MHTKKTNKLARQRAALQLLSGAGNGRSRDSRDSFTISSEARKFSRERIAALTQGESLWDVLHSRKEVLATCEKVGITPGFFSIDAGIGKHTYILQEFGGVIDVDKNITRWNNMNWIEVGYKEGDTFSIYGNEYTVDSSGHIHISANDTFTSTDVKFARRDI